MKHWFEYAMANDDQLQVELTIYPGDPGRLYGEPGDCSPPEPTTADIDSVKRYEGGELVPFEIDGLYVERRRSIKCDKCGRRKFNDLEDDILIKGIEDWETRDE